MIVRPVPTSLLVACQSEEQLTELISHAINHEKTKYEAMFLDFSCAPIPSDGTFKVLSLGQHTVEFTAQDSGKSRGMWAAEEAFLPHEQP